LDEHEEGCLVRTTQ
jgi:hypothetical protein